MSREIPEEARALLAKYRPTADEAQRLADLISYLEGTTADQWCVDVVRTDNSPSAQNCVFGHIFNWGVARGDGSDLAGSRAWDWFEGAWSTTYAVYPVNDGTNADYPQPTARERAIAYLRDLHSGEVPSTMESMEWEFQGGDIEALRAEHSSSETRGKVDS